MGENGVFREEQGIPLEPDEQEGDVPERRTFSQENHEEARLIIDHLRRTRLALGVTDRSGRIGLTPIEGQNVGIGVDLPERYFHPRGTQAKIY